MTPKEYKIVLLEVEIITLEAEVETGKTLYNNTFGLTEQVKLISERERLEGKLDLLKKALKELK